MKKVILSLFLSVGINLSCLAAQNATDIYLLAQTKSTTELKKAENIDAVNPNGDTALCVAIKNNDADAYNILIKTGANPNHQCVKNIPTEQYNAFMNKVATTNKRWSFLGIGKWGWSAIGAGVVAAGSAVAAMNGGGSGSDTGGFYPSDSGNSSDTGSSGNNQENGGGITDDNPGTQPDEPSDGTGYNYDDVTISDQNWITAFDVENVSDFVNYGDITLTNIFSHATGIYGGEISEAKAQIANVTNHGNISISVPDTTSATGIVGKNVSNDGDVNINVRYKDSDSSSYTGISGYNTIDNTGIITISGNFERATGIHLYNHLNEILSEEFANNNAMNNNKIIIIAEAANGAVRKFGEIDGMRAADKKYNALHLTNNGLIDIHVSDKDNVENSWWINGMSGSTYSVIKNNGEINIIQKPNGYVTNGISGDNYSTIENMGNILIGTAENPYGMATGIRVGKNTTVSNRGNITVFSDDTAHGIWATGDESTIDNYGNINIFGPGKSSSVSYTGIVAPTQNTNITNHNRITLGSIDMPVYSATGIMTSDNSSVINDREININTSNSGTGISVVLSDGTIVNNKGKITINGTDNTKQIIGIGIIVMGKSTAINEGEISINNTQSAEGIWASSGATAVNSGTIQIGTAENPVAKVYGIYAEDKGTTVINTGTITINGKSCVGDSCKGYSGNHISLNNGAAFINGGEMSASAFDFDDMGGSIVATNGARFIAENGISGTLNISSDIVTDGFDTTYTAENMIQASDTSKLTLRSGSAMFDAKLADNGNDVVMTMKSFDTLTDNKSLAAYLADNYAKGTSAEFFGGLKSGANMVEFNNILNGLSGLNAFTQFDREDMSAMREINFSMNQQMFMNSNRDEYEVSGSMEHFSFSNSSNGGSGSYGISNSRMSDNWKLGYGLAMANIGTNDDMGTSRSNQIGLFYMPMTYTNDDIELISTPRVGFAKSHYNRRGYNNMNYDGYIEKQIFGFNNDLRYPLTFGNWTIAPDLGFNAIMYRQSGHESDQAFSLVIPADEIYSVEAGLGLFTKYEKQLSYGGSLRFNSGVMMYRELADTYNMKLGIRGLDGTFNLYDDAEHDYSGAATFGFDYSVGRLNLYGNAQYFVDSGHYMNFKSGISYRF